MMEKRWTCDKCGCLILEGRIEVKVEHWPLRRGGTHKLDLCADCHEGFSRWLRQGEAEAVLAPPIVSAPAPH